MLRVLRAKLHGLKVTDANLDYHGSITLDPEHCARVGIVPTEFVEIWNKTNGERISTYVIFGQPGSRCCILNGAAARTCQRGDELILAATTYLDVPALPAVRPKVLTFRGDNEADELLEYVIESPTEKNGHHGFVVHSSTEPGEALTPPVITERRAQAEAELVAGGMDAEQARAFVRRHVRD